MVSVCILLCSCQSEDTFSKTPVIINLPADNTVNGYKLPSIESSSGTDSTTEKPDTNIQYCANIKSKTFHLTSCSGVKNMKEENKYFISDRNSLIEDGFKPCGTCKP